MATELRTSHGEPEKNSTDSPLSGWPLVGFWKKTKTSGTSKVCVLEQRRELAPDTLTVLFLLYMPLRDRPRKGHPNMSASNVKTPQTLKTNTCHVQVSILQNHTPEGYKTLSPLARLVSKHTLIDCVFVAIQSSQVQMLWWYTFCTTAVPWCGQWQSRGYRDMARH